MKQPEFIQELFKCFPRSYITQFNEIILEEKGNVYLRLDDVNNYSDVVIKLLEFCSRQIAKGMPYKREWLNEKYRANLREKANNYIGKQFSAEDWWKIYDSLGNGVNHSLTLLFMAKDFDTTILEVNE